MVRVDVKYKTNPNGMRELLNSPGMQQAVTEAAEGIQVRAQSMFGATNYGLSPARPGKNRCHAIVYTGDTYAIRSNALHQTLLKSIKG